MAPTTREMHKTLQSTKNDNLNHNNQSALYFMTLIYLQSTVFVKLHNLFRHVNGEIERWKKKNSAVCVFIHRPGVSLTGSTEVSL